jgi:hypothetical protein
MNPSALLASRMIRGPLASDGVRVALILLGFGLGTLLPTRTDAQVRSGECELQDTFRTLTSREVEPGVSILWVSLPDLRCPNGLRIRADSAVVYEGTGRNELIGNVRFITAERDLRARRANWLERDGQLLASGSVVFVDLQRGTRVTGEELTYVEARDGRDDFLEIWGGRPTATLPVDPSPNDPPGVRPSPYLVTANRLRFAGETTFWGDGRVEVVRDSLQARADSLVFDRAAGQLTFRVDAELDRGDVAARGQTLVVTLVDDRLRSLVAREDAELRTPEFTFAGAEVSVQLGEGERLERLTSESGVDPLTGEVLLAELRAEGLGLEGRRVEVEDAPDGTRVLRAFGSARAEALGDGFGAQPTRDGVAGDSASAPDPSREVQGETAEGGEGSLFDRDWIEGDELFAFFEPVTNPETPGAGAGEPGETEPAWRLVRLEAHGSARALYRGRAEAVGPASSAVAADPVAGGITVAPEALRPISYIMADRILLHLEGGELKRLEAEGNVRGGQLEPRRTSQGGGDGG